MKSVERVRHALLAAGHTDNIAEFPAGTHSAAEAAAAVGCTVAQIAKSIVFQAGDDAVLVIASGANRIDRKKVSTKLGYAVKSAAPAWVQAKTGFAVGGVSPIGLMCPVAVVIDADLLLHAELWAAAGSPMHAFQTSTDALVAMTGGLIADVRQD